MSETSPESQSKGDADRAPTQFRLRSLLLFTGLTAGAFGVCRLLDLGLATALFVTGFFALAALVTVMMGSSHSTMVEVMRTHSEQEALLCHNYLRDRGLAVVVQSEQLGGITGLVQNSSRVMIAREQLPEATAVMKGHSELKRFVAVDNV